MVFSSSGLGFLLGANVALNFPLLVTLLIGFSRSVFFPQSAHEAIAEKSGTDDSRGPNY